MNDVETLIVETLRSEVKPAMGCTEPVAVALCCGKARELAPYRELRKAVVSVSGNIYKNGMGVGVPNTGESGLEIAAALGLVCGDSARGLEILADVRPEDVEKAHQLLESGRVAIAAADSDASVFIEAFLETDNGTRKAVVKGRHSHFALLEVDGKALLRDEPGGSGSGDGKSALYSMRVRDIIRAIEGIPADELAFLLEGVAMNMDMARIGLENGGKGMRVGYGILKDIEDGLIAPDLAINAALHTAAAADARMSGVPRPVMSSNGSGNNGLTAIIPIAVYCGMRPTPPERVSRALAISHMVNCFIKGHIGRLSALCGCSIAAGAGAAAGLAWLMDFTIQQLEGAVQNVLANVSGIICDGAKEGCALKLSTSAHCAVLSTFLAKHGSIVRSLDGIVDDTLEGSIRNLRRLSEKGMRQTDRTILDTMLEMRARE